MDIKFIALIFITLVVGAFSGYLIGRTKTFGDTKVSILQIFGMTAFLMYFGGAIGGLIEFNEVALSIILAFTSGETVGEAIKGVTKK